MHDAILNEHLAAENAHDLDRIMATYTASPVIELSGSRIEGTVAVREFHRSFGFAGSGSFSNVHVAERARLATGDAIVVEQTLSGVHTGTWRDVAPTGRAFSIAVCTVYRFGDGRLASEHVYLDEARLRRRLTEPSAFRPSRDIILRTEHAAEAVQFYRDVLGLPATLDQPGLVGFEAGAFQLFVESGAPAHGPIFELYAPSLEDAKQRLVAAGCVIVEEDPAMPRCYVRDPYGFVFNVAER